MYKDTITLTVNDDGTVTKVERTWIGKRGHDTMVLTRPKKVVAKYSTVADAEMMFGAEDRVSEEYHRCCGARVEVTIKWVR